MTDPDEPTHETSAATEILVAAVGPKVAAIVAPDAKLHERIAAAFILRQAYHWGRNQGWTHDKAWAEAVDTTQEDYQMLAELQGFQEWMRRESMVRLFNLEVDLSDRP